MPTFTIVGETFGTFLQPNEEMTEEENGVMIAVRRYRTLYASWLSTVALRGSAHPKYPRMTLRTRKATQHESGLICDVEVTYRSPDPEDNGGSSAAEPAGGGGGPDTPPEPGQVLPPVEYTENAAEMTVDIRQHPNFYTGENFSQYWDFEKAMFKDTAPGYLQGVSGYVVGSVTETELTYYWSRPASVRNEVNKTSDGRKWMVLTGTRVKRGIYWTRSLTRLYNPNGWPEQLYPN